MVTEYNGECVVMVVMGTTRLLNANGECWMRSEEEEKKRKRGKVEKKRKKKHLLWKRKESTTLLKMLWDTRCV